MAKRLAQASLKISKKQPTHQFNSLIKVLKPKVYITNSSNFKTLVQELTGNGSHSPEPSSFSPPPTVHVMSSEPAHVIQIDDHDSPDPSLDNIFMQYDYSTCASEELGLQWSNQDRIMDYESPDPSLDRSLGSSPDPSLDNMFMQFDGSSNCSSEELGLQWSQDKVIDYVNEIELRNLESWLLDIDSSACSHDVTAVPMNTYKYEYNMPSSM